MISRAHRFHSHASLRFVYQHGKTERSSLMALKYIVNDRRQTYRAAVVVSRKVHKSAVVRNRIRRRLYEIIRQHEGQITEPYDIVVTVFSEQLAEVPASELQAAMTGLLHSAGIVKPSRRAHATDLSHVDFLNRQGKQAP